MEQPRGKLLIIGFGPGAFDHITDRARTAIEESQVVIGYNTYVDLIRGLLSNQEIVRTGMTEEVTRAQEAVRQAERGKKVAVISSGDAGVYGMAGLVYEVLIEKQWNPATGVEVEVIPGISAINSCASLLGAPVMHDACTISLSDHLTPWEMIASRVEAAASADFVIALYNPRSGKRTRQIVETQRILLQYRSADTPVGLVKSAYREREQVIVTTLGNMLQYDIGMLTTVIIGNSATFIYHGKMVTPRGYQRKYTLDAAEQQLKPHERLKVESEPWSLNAQEKALSSQKDGTQITDHAAVPVFSFDSEISKPTIAASQTGDSELNPAHLASEALRMLEANGIVPVSDMAEMEMPSHRNNPISIFEVGVAPGIANKKYSAQQMTALTEIIGDAGEMEYTPNHQIILRVPTDDPSHIISRLSSEQLLIFPVGDVSQIKACDFCNLEKADAIPVAEQLNLLLGGIKTPKELSIGVNGCAMACYGAVLEDIGIVFRRGAYDLYLGGKKIGRNAHPAQVVAEGIAAEQIVPTVERIVRQFVDEAHPNERFHKFFKRVGNVGGFPHRDHIPQVVVDAVCGD